MTVFDKVLAEGLKHSDATVGNAPTPRNELAEACGALENTLDRLNAALNALSNRLAPVCAAAPPATAVENVSPLLTSSALTSFLAAQGFHAQRMLDKVNATLDALRL